MHTFSFVIFATSLFWPAAGPSFREMFRALFHHLGGCSYGVQQFSRLIRQVLPLCDHAILRALEDALLFERFAHSTPDEQLNARCLNKNAPDGDSVSTVTVPSPLRVAALPPAHRPKDCP